MTLVIAQRHEDQVMILADTKIMDPSKTRPDIIPGRLKAIILGPGLSVAFAGNADAASLAIENARDALLFCGIEDAINIIQSDSREGETDYIIACHSPKAELLCLRRGGRISVPDICSIGDDDCFKDAIKKAIDSQKRLLDSDLRTYFYDRLLTGQNIGEKIGGFPVTIYATNESHNYMPFFGSYTYKFPKLKSGMPTYQEINQVYTGDGHFEFGILPPETPNLPVLGAYSLQAKMGYIYSPIEQVDPYCIRLWPSDQPWEGHEDEMLQILKKAINDHVLNVSSHNKIRKKIISS